MWLVGLETGRNGELLLKGHGVSIQGDEELVNVFNASKLQTSKWS